MTRWLSLAMLLLAASTAHAAGQRENCDLKGKGLADQERSHVVSDCIRRNASISSTPASPMSPLARMSRCNREAGDMTGEARVRFVDSCLQRSD